jgi:regulatory protein
MALQKRARKLTSEELFEYAVKCLGVRAYSVGDLKLRLRMRAANPSDVDGLIGRLQDIGYLNDQRFAENYASARVANEGFGRMRVLNDLRARQVSGNMAEQAVEQALAGKSEAELIEEPIEEDEPET